MDSRTNRNEVLPIKRLLMYKCVKLELKSNICFNLFFFCYSKVHLITCICVFVEF